MANVLIVESDPVFAAVLEDRLHVAGHRTVWVHEPAQAISAAAEGTADAVILTMEMDVVPGVEVIRQLRQQSETRNLLIVALSEKGQSADRLGALKAGADDYLTKPFDLEELIIRLDRLLGRRGAAPSVMKGDLRNHPPWELVQYIQQAGKSGQLVIRGTKGSGRVQTLGGKVISARWKELRGRDALLAILDAKEGNFQLTTEDSSDDSQISDSSVAFPIPEVLMQYAWLEDQLRKRKEYLPATGMPLRATARDLPTVEPELAALPMEKIFQRIVGQSGVRLYDLMSEAEPPSKIRIAVAWLMEKGLIAIDQPSGSIMTTSEISSTLILDVAIHNLLSAARDAGFDTSGLPYLLLVEEDVWPQLQNLLESVPGFQRIESMRNLVEQLKLRQGGSATFETEYGSMSLHVQILNKAMKTQVEAIIPVCAGVMVWLHEAQDTALLSSIIRRLEGAGDATVGVVVAHTADSLGVATSLLGDTQRWRISKHEPHSLIGVFRLLHPRASSR